MKRNALCAVGMLICLLGLPLSGCCGIEPTYEPATITFAYAVSGARDDRVDYYEQMVQAFSESHPHVTVKLVPNRLANGRFDASGADVFLAAWFSLDALHAQGETMTLDQFIEEDGSLDLADFYAGGLEVFQTEGKTWAIPASIDVPVVFYNQDLFDRYGVPYPQVDWTREDFQAAALALTDPGVEAFGYVPTAYPFDPILFIYQHGGQIYEDVAGSIHPTFDDPLNVEALEWYAGLIHDQNVIPTPDQLREKDYLAAVLQGRVGMWTGMLSSRGGAGWPVDWDMRWGVVPFPQDARSAAILYVSGYAISSQTSHPDACWQWLVFLSEHAHGALGEIPPRKSLVETDAFEDLVGSDVAAAGRASVASEMAIAPLDIDAAFAEEGLFPAFVRALDQIVAGQAEPEDAMMRAQEQVER